VSLTTRRNNVYDETRYVNHEGYQKSKYTSERARIQITKTTEICIFMFTSLGGGGYSSLERCVLP
jgi:hypothetical protein